MITEVYFIEGYFSKTFTGSSSRVIRTFEKGAKGAPSGMLVHVRRTLRKGSTEDAMIGGGYLRRWPYVRSVYLLEMY